MSPLIIADQAYLNRYLKPRLGETKVGQRLQLAPPEPLELALASLTKSGVKYALLGIPEDIGPRANLGRGGSDKGWPAFLTHFVNLQHNQYIKSEEIALIGHIQCEDLQKLSQQLNLTDKDDLSAIRQLVTQLDERVSAVIQQIVAHDLIPIVIGGGHNNALPIIQGVSQAKQGAIGAINLDPHSDFRALEGRHSGNGFSYAASAGHLSHYFCLGLHELKNSEPSLASLAQYNFKFISIQQLVSRREMTLQQALETATTYLKNSEKLIGIELDLDSISFMPASAYTNAGMSLADAQFYVHTIASQTPSCYLHLAEGAPEQHPAGVCAGNIDVGQALANLVLSFIQANQLVVR